MFTPAYHGYKPFHFKKNGPTSTQCTLSDNAHV